MRSRHGNPEPEKTPTVRYVWRGFHPEIAYTKMGPGQHSGSAAIAYFDANGRHLGTGTLADDIAFKYAVDARSRRYPGQIVDSTKFYGMVQDATPLLPNGDLDVKNLCGGRN